MRERWSDWGAVARRRSLRPRPILLDRHWPEVTCCQSHPIERVRAFTYLGLCLIRRHIIIVGTTLVEQCLLYESIVLGISGVFPVIDQAIPYSSTLPPIYVRVRVVKEAKGVARFAAIVIAEQVIGYCLGGFLDRT